MQPKRDYRGIFFREGDGFTDPHLLSSSALITKFIQFGRAPGSVARVSETSHEVEKSGENQKSHNGYELGATLFPLPVQL